MHIKCIRHHIHVVLHHRNPVYTIASSNDVIFLRNYISIATYMAASTVYKKGSYVVKSVDAFS